MTFTYAVIDETTRETVKDSLVRVKRRSSETDAYFIADGIYKVMTSNGESMCEAPVWILWDTSGYPYPITLSEFEELYSPAAEEAFAQHRKVELSRLLHPSTARLLELFEYKHLPEHLQRISKQFHDLAWSMAQEPTERPEEKTTCLRKLREAKDCAVTMGVPVGEISSNSPPLKTNNP